MFESLTLRFRKKRTRRPRKPAWLIARTALVLVAAFFTALTSLTWFNDLAPAQGRQIALFVAIGFAVVDLTTPLLVPKLAEARGAALAGLTLAAIVCGSVSTIGLGFAFDKLDRTIAAEAFEATLTRWTTETETPLQTSLDAAIAALDAVTLVEPECVCPQTKAMELDIWTAKRKPLAADVERLRGELDQLKAPALTDRVPIWAALALAAALQLALAVGMVSLEGARLGVWKRATADYEDRLTLQRENRARRQAEADDSDDEDLSEAA